MDKIVEKILNESDLKQLKSFLLKEEPTIGKYLSNIDDALNSLDMTQYSLGYAFLLYFFYIQIFFLKKNSF